MERGGVLLLASGAHRNPRAPLGGYPGSVGGRSPNDHEVAGDQTVKGHSMGQFERRVTKLSLALLLAGGGLLATGLEAQPPAQAAPAHTTHISHVSSVGGPTWYGAGSTTWMVEATIGIDRNRGVATIAASRPLQLWSTMMRSILERACRCPAHLAITTRLARF